MQKTFFILLSFIIMSCSGIKKNTVQQSNNKVNSQKARKLPYVLLISLDGFRWDYVKKYNPKFLTGFSKRSASLKSLMPSYPTKTFPNHLSIVTGSYPQNHGIIANHFYAPDLKKTYSLGDRDAVKNSDFYKSLPIWGLAEKNGIKTATYFWPGSETSILNERPSYYLDYNHSTPHQERIDTVVSWFEMKDENRPHFATLYFHDVDSAGHRYGPDSDEVKAAIDKVDKSLEQLHKRLLDLKLDLNIIIVSDHGMAQLDSEKYESLSKEILKGFRVLGSGPIVHIYKQENSPSIKLTLSALNKKAVNYKCYQYKDTPKKFNIYKNQRVGDITCLAKRGWSIGHGINRVPKGSHGWSQFDSKDMHGIFYANGPAFKNSVEIKTLSNIDIYPLLAQILKIKIPHKIDGDIKEIKQLLK